MIQWALRGQTFFDPYNFFSSPSQCSVWFLLCAGSSAHWVACSTLPGNARKIINTFVLSFCCCPNKWPQREWLKTTIFFFIFSSVGQKYNMILTKLKSKVTAGLLKAQSISCLFRLLAEFISLLWDWVLVSLLAVSGRPFPASRSCSHSWALGFLPLFWKSAVVGRAPLMLWVSLAPSVDSLADDLG